MTFFRRLRNLIPTRQKGPVRVVTDSTSDLPPEVAAELGITVVPLQVMFGSEAFQDGVELSSEEFYHRLPLAHELPKTSQPSVGQFHGVYEALVGETERILSIHLSSRFSGTIDAARLAARDVADRCQIEVLDSGTVSMAMGLAVMAAARAARDGAELPACADAARSVLRRMRLAVALDTLEYLRRGGRIGRAQAFVGGLLRLKPILTVRDGEAHPLARVRTRRKALDEIVNICLADDAIEQAAIMHATTPDDARYVADEIERRRPGTPVHLGRFGPVLGVHGGPGMIGLAVVLRDEPGPAPGTT